MTRTFRQLSPRTLLGVAVVVALGLLLGWWASAKPPEVGPLDPVVASPAERLQVVDLAWGQTFGEVLENANIGWSDQNSLLLAFREQANPRRMRDGTRITVRWFPETADLRGIDVRLSRDETVRLQRDEAGWSSSTVQTPIVVDTLFIAGTIDYTLSDAVTELAELTELPFGDRVEIVDKLDKVFQWQVDFSRQTREGDTYRFTLEREVRPDGSMRTSHLLAAEFVNQSTPYRAIWFDPNNDGEGTYYDEEGKSVRRAFLLKPIPLSRISSAYSDARLHPIHNYVRPHRGVDFAAPSGTPIQATSDGVVIYADWRGELGNLVEIRAPNGWVSRYGHMSRFAVRVGNRVRQGQTIGYVGMTGGATGPHVHYELRRNGQALDPLSIRLPAGDPVPTTSWGRWALESEERLLMLEKLPGPPIFANAEEENADSSDDGPNGGGD
jgi:murein DD-endopeptidase MepM/ murein hydrolase activator NlpD